ncbi:MAG: chemotaxis protein CheA [Lyngbya sp. HA4199-MV5]|jgi:two-component system chemotaxis sensor kinase CheA|nr:chemotaxis protein CheA [Lyngbya sp. HA4199-MV5]
MQMEPQNSLFDSFLDDFFAECDDYLTTIRQSLLAIEAYVEQLPIDSKLLDELFRGFHSLKGLSGMVEVHVAEELAHHLESYLRELRDRQLRLSNDGLDVLIKGTNLLEQAIIAHRHQTAAPDITPVLKQLTVIGVYSAYQPGIQPETVIGECHTQTSEFLKNSEVLSDSNGSVDGSLNGSSNGVKPEVETPDAEQPDVEKPDAEKSDNQSADETNQDTLQPTIEKQVWALDFTPTPDLTARGINVNSVRDRIKSIGTILQAEPRALPAGGVGFHFLVESTTAATTFTPWETDGIAHSPHQPNPQTITETIHSSPEPITVQESPLPTPYSPLPTPHPSPLTPHSSLSSNLVRVDLDKLNDLMRMVGDLVVSRSRLEDCLSHVSNKVAHSQLRNLQEIDLTLERQIRDLREGVMRVRLVPIAEVFARMQFVVKDVARECGKQVALELVGQDTEIDKFVVERMMEPLLHLVRNAVSHGLETTEERIARGKPATGKMILRAATDGEMVVIEVQDDGNGIDRDRVAARAQTLGLLDTAITDTDQLLEILCASGFSTREQADLASGRGVGMAVVKNTIAELGGLLQLDTQTGSGTRFIIHLPLTLSIASALIVTVGDQVYAIPQGSLQEVIQVSPAAIVSLETDEILSYRDGVLALVRLSRLFGVPSHSSETACVLVVRAGLNQVGIVVDRVLSQQEIVVHALTDPLVQTPGITGATELGNGQGVLILDAAALIRAAQQRRRVGVGGKDKG